MKHEFNRAQKKDIIAITKRDGAETQTRTNKTLSHLREVLAQISVLNTAMSDGPWQTFRHGGGEEVAESIMLKTERDQWVATPQDGDPVLEPCDLNEGCKFLNYTDAQWEWIRSDAHAMRECRNSLKAWAAAIQLAIRTIEEVTRIADHHRNRFIEQLSD
jgi:hypothetical protein